MQKTSVTFTFCDQVATFMEYGFLKLLLRNQFSLSVKRIPTASTRMYRGGKSYAGILPAPAQGCLCAWEKGSFVGLVSPSVSGCG